jgi:hypothetical protein
MVGGFNDVGAIETSNMVRWSGDRRTTGKWSGFDLITPAYTPSTSVRGTISDLAIHPNGDMFVALGSQYNGVPPSIIQAAAVTEIVNPGTAETEPRVYVRGPGRLRYLANHTTGAEVFFDLEILSSEEVTIDVPEARVTSTVRGDLSYGVLGVSSLKSFVMVPGTNRISALMTDGIDSIMQMAFDIRHWAADATSKVEALS